MSINDSNVNLCACPSGQGRGLDVDAKFCIAYVHCLERMILLGISGGLALLTARSTHCLIRPIAIALATIPTSSVGTAELLLAPREKGAWAAITGGLPRSTSGAWLGSQSCIWRCDNEGTRGCVDNARWWRRQVWIVRLQDTRSRAEWACCWNCNERHPRRPHI